MLLELASSELGLGQEAKGIHFDASLGLKWIQTLGEGARTALQSKEPHLRTGRVERDGGAQPGP